MSSSRDLAFYVNDKTGVFNYRVVAVILHEDHVLIHKQNDDNFWGLPGGRCGFMESSEIAICRELKEELGYDLQAERLLWTCENFFEYDSKSFHELSTYYLFYLSNSSLSLFENHEFLGIEDYPNIQFKWIPISEIHHYDIKPQFLLKGISSLPLESQHIVFRDVNLR